MKKTRREVISTVTNIIDKSIFHYDPSPDRIHTEIALNIINWLSENGYMNQEWLDGLSCEMDSS